MKIAFVPAARVLSDSEPNGEALIAVAMLRRLAARGHDIVAYCERSDLQIEGVDIREISAAGVTSALGRIGFARRIARDAASLRYDVAHLLFPFTTHEGYTLASGPLVCGPINLPWPSVVRPARRAARVAAAITNRVERRLHERTLRRAAKLLTTGESARRAIPERAHDRVAELPFGVDLERFAATELPGEATILFFSVLLERKGPDVVLRAMPEVLQRVPRARLVIAGTDPGGMLPALQARARELGIDAAVDFAGAIAPKDAPSMYARARVFCQPSFGEPFGMTVVEAMASARPIVATRGGGILDAVVEGEGGRLVRPGDPRSLADAICSILERPADAARMGVFNRARAEVRYSLDLVIDRLEETYAEVAPAGVRHVPAA